MYVDLNKRKAAELFMDVELCNFSFGFIFCPFFNLGVVRASVVFITELVL